MTTAFTWMSRFVYLFPISFPYWIFLAIKTKNKSPSSNYEKPQQEKKLGWVCFCVASDWNVNCDCISSSNRQVKPNSQQRKEYHFHPLIKLNQPNRCVTSNKEISDEHLYTEQQVPWFLTKNKNKNTNIPSFCTKLLQHREKSVGKPQKGKKHNKNNITGTRNRETVTYFKLFFKCRVSQV